MLRTKRDENKSDTASYIGWLPFFASLQASHCSHKTAAGIQVHLTIADQLISLALNYANERLDDKTPLQIGTSIRKLYI